MANTTPDPEILAAFAQRTTSRRRFLGMSGLALGGLALGPTFLAACSSGSSSDKASGDAGRITMLNWPLYIENDDPSTSATIAGFTKATGIKVTYDASIDGNESFNTKYADTLDKGKGIGADLIVLTSWNAAAYIGADRVQAFDDSVFVNKKNLLTDLTNPNWDPGRRFSVPWAIGQTGLAYYPDKVGGEITDVNAIFDPKFKGKVTILDELRDTVGLTMLGMGYNPTTGTKAQMLEAIDKIARARDDGQFRKVTGNSYTEDLELGDTWLAVGWSGDVASSTAYGEGTLSWAIPEQGGMKWIDNAMIPVGASNAKGANEFLNYVYTPAVAAPLYEAINYTSPVQGATALMTPEAQASPFINPPATPPLYDFNVLSPDDIEEVSRAFTAATEQ
ncbi:MAG: spermidine/putrescine ABC transporter substrate-binding protein [Actinobacteria bacterium]|nr:spermidine/putrescine ABC transporter substrate-binding protein [Actinomycetota bacterium]